MTALEGAPNITSLLVGATKSMRDLEWASNAMIALEQELWLNESLRESHLLNESLGGSPQISESFIGIP